MSQDGVWVEPGDVPAVVSEVERLSRALRDAHLLVAAIVTQHGEALGNGRYRMPVDPAHLETAEVRRLSVHLDPMSGAVLVRVDAP